MKNVKNYLLSTWNLFKVSSNLEILFDGKKKAAKQIRYEVNFNKKAVKMDNCNSVNVNEEILNGDDMGACVEEVNSNISHTVVLRNHTLKTNLTNE